MSSHKSSALTAVLFTLGTYLRCEIFFSDEMVDVWNGSLPKKIFFLFFYPGAETIKWIDLFVCFS